MTVSNAQQRAATIFNVIPIFLIAAAFTAGMQIATDATAGERERFSLEPFLINPVPRWQLIGENGWRLRWPRSPVWAPPLALQLMSCFVFPWKIWVSGNIWVGRNAFCLFAALAPVALIAPALQIYLACFAKTFKEAQSYMAFLVLASLLPGMIAAVYPLGDAVLMKPIPILGQYTLSVEILGGKIPSPLLFGIAGVTALLFAALFLWLARPVLFGKDCLGPIKPSLIMLRRLDADETSSFRQTCKSFSNHRLRKYLRP